MSVGGIVAIVVVGIIFWIFVSIDKDKQNKDKTYTAEVMCGNCEHLFKIKVPMGKSVVSEENKTTCPNCHMKGLN